MDKQRLLRPNPLLSRLSLRFGGNIVKRSQLYFCYLGNDVQLFFFFCCFLFCSIILIRFFPETGSNYNNITKTLLSLDILFSEPQDTTKVLLKYYQDTI